MTTQRYVSRAFVPTSNRASNDSSGMAIVRGTNLFIRGQGANVYSECYGGSANLNEDIPAEALTGTLAFSPVSKVITGTTTDFQAELHLGQRMETLAGEIVVVSEITDATHFVAANFPLTTASGQTAYRLPIIFELDKKRGTLLSGNALEFDMGTILAVGSGTLRVNGAVLSASLVASKSAKIAIYQPATDNYLVQTLGFIAEPYGISVAAGTAPVSQTFTNADVNTGTDRITIAGHGYQTGQKVLLTNPGTQISIAGTPIVGTTPYFIIRIDANTVQLASTLANSTVPTALDITNAGAGTTTVAPVSKIMPAGDRSIRVAKASTKLGTPAYGNPGEKLKVTLTAGQSIAVSFPAMDSNTDANNPHDAWRIYASTFGGTTATATANADSGAWYWVRTVTAAELGTTGAATYNLEYLDAEIDGTLRLITFDNDAPQDAEMVATVAGYPVLVSCQGKATIAKPNGTSPGPSIVPFKPFNIAAAPLVLDSNQRNEVPLSPPELIIGCYMAAGRLYLMTANTLQIGVFTADSDFPVATRPFWKAGFKNPYSLCFVNGILYGFTGNGPTRSETGDNVAEGSEEHKFALQVQELTKDWRPENVFVIEDPKNECVCYVHTGGTKNEDGFWITEIIPFMYGSGEWSHQIVYTSSTRDCIVTGVATVNGRFEFLMGGRDGLGAIDIETRRFDEPDGSPVPYNQAWAFWDGGSEDRPKKIKNPRVTGKVTSGTIGIFGAESGENIDIDLIESGNAASKSGAIALDAGTGVEYRAREDCAVRGLMSFAPNIEGVWSGTGERDRLDELTLDILTQGRRM